MSRLPYRIGTSDTPVCLSSHRRFGKSKKKENWIARLLRSLHRAARRAAYAKGKDRRGNVRHPSKTTPYVQYWATSIYYNGSRLSIMSLNSMSTPISSPCCSFSTPMRLSEWLLATHRPYVHKNSYTVRCNRADIAVSVSSYNDIEL